MSELAKEMYNRYNGIGMYFALFLVSLLYLYINNKKNKNILVFPSLLTLIIIFIPVLSDFIGKYIIGELVYWRMFWLLPITLIIAYATTYMIHNEKNKTDKIIISIAAILIISLSGSFIFTKDNFSIPENYFKIPNGAIDISLMVQADKKDNPEDIDAKLAAPYELACTIRQYDATIPLLYGRRPEESYSSGSVEVAEELRSLEPNMKTISKIARKYKCKYIVLTIEQNPSVLPEEEGYKELGRRGHYILYKDTVLEIETDSSAFDYTEQSVFRSLIAIK